eukprot:scaffold42099_cov60-Phaeocystis_antarctica.AAC.4
MGRPVFSGDVFASQQAGELTAPPEGMYWAQVQGLWALCPIVDLERSVDLIRASLCSTPPLVPSPPPHGPWTF